MLLFSSDVAFAGVSISRSCDNVLPIIFSRRDASVEQPQTAASTVAEPAGSGPDMSRVRPGCEMALAQCRLQSWQP